MWLNSSAQDGKFGEQQSDEAPDVTPCRSVQGIQILGSYKSHLSFKQQVAYSDRHEKYIYTCVCAAVATV